MTMKFSQYNEILDSLEKLMNEDNCLNQLYTLFPKINHFTLGSIYAQCIQRKVKKFYHKISQPDEICHHYNKYCTAVENKEPSGIILRMAKQHSFSPAMMAKLILEHQLNTVAKREGLSGGVSRSQINKLLRDTTQIQDRDLSYEVYICLIQDDVYGPFSDSIKHSLGHEYEFLLKNKLEALKIGYQDETVLRDQGYDKTPDIKLDIPIAVEGKVINWIESKASFGDEENHRSYLRDQFWSYWNRFGPGLVIYWFGFIEELDVHSEKGIILRDHLPDDITFLNPLAGVNS